MNKIGTILRETGGRIITREEFDSLADKYKFNKNILRRVMLNKGYLLTIFRGIYYIKSYEEKKFNTLKYSSYELLSIGLEKKKIKWYFGLNTAIKFLGLTHEVFPVNIVINNKFNRKKSMKIAGSNFLFIKLKPSLFFGIIKKKTENNVSLYHSRLEKTLLDMVYLKKTIDIKEYKFNKSLFIRESRNYSRIVKKKIAEQL